MLYNHIAKMHQQKSTLYEYTMKYLLLDEFN